MFILISENGELWLPKSHNRICSTHFIGNKKSNDPQSPSYVPSIFPEVYKKTKCNHKQQLERYNRAANKKLNSSKTFTYIVSTIRPHLSTVTLNNLQ